ncbi:putative odorant receptor 71a [Diachasmimorpha longicaudata]|uniref:putative odorant receptor 71a n=1 Tax=Diachasmimorpha longicaudata TaxID=58733 RepID=UPI0030B8F070
MFNANPFRNRSRNFTFKKISRHGTPGRCETSCVYKRISVYSMAYIMIATAYYGIDEFMRAWHHRILPLDTWVPYNCSDPLLWWLSSVYLTIAMLYAIIFNTIYNVFFFEMMMQIVVHQKLISQRKLFVRRNCRSARDIKLIFSFVVLMQYLTTSLILCSTVYIMSGTPVFSRNFGKLTLYFGAILHQIFLLCYAGHRTRLEFESIPDVLYTSNWIALSEAHKQSIKFMMINSKKPFVFTCCGILKLDLHALKNTLQFAYSIYNIL